MHQVPRLRTEVVRGFPEFSRRWTKARITKTVRTPTDKSVWGTSEKTPRLQRTSEKLVYLRCVNRGLAHKCWLHLGGKPAMGIGTLGVCKENQILCLDFNASYFPN